MRFADEIPHLFHDVDDDRAGFVFPLAFRTGIGHRDDGDGRKDAEFIARTDLPALLHDREHALPGHDAVSGKAADLAVRVAFLADLGHPQDRRPAAEADPDGKLREIDAGYHDVLREIAGLQRFETGFGKALLRGFIFLIGQQADRPVPAAGMGVAFDAPVLDEHGFIDLFFLRAAHLADADGHYVSHSHPPIWDIDRCSSVF